jgi:hypothetical protein
MQMLKCEDVKCENEKCRAVIEFEIQQLHLLVFEFANFRINL